ncbi:MAG: DUF3147 family protein [Candidatus Acidiferrum sp.]
MTTLIIRFMVGGAVVSAFSMIGEIVGPKSPAGIFGAAPSVAIATLGLTIATDGRLVATQESHSMLFGALAFFLYACCCFALLAKRKWRATMASLGTLLLWVLSAFGFWFAFLR